MCTIKNNFGKRYFAGKTVNINKWLMGEICIGNLSSVQNKFTIISQRHKTRSASILIPSVI